MDNREKILRVEGLCKYFGNGPAAVRAVDDVSFDIKKGEVFGLVGESGCGKTTTGRAIIRLYDITSGSVYFKGRRICAGTRSYEDAIKNARSAYRRGDISKEEYLRETHLSAENIKAAKRDAANCDRRYSQARRAAINEEYAKLTEGCSDETAHKRLEKEKNSRLRLAKRDKLTNGIQMIFQDPIASLNPRMTVREIIAEGLIIRGIRDRKYIDERVYRVLNLVGLLPEHAGRYPHEFSGGQRQRIGIARAVILNPELIIADEPVSALDVSVQAQVINLLNGLREELGLTILFIAHDLSVVKYFSDRIGVMYSGKIVELAGSDELFARPLHPYTRSLLSAIPIPDPELEKSRRRIAYNPLAEHDYTSDKPKMREITAGHSVFCNDAEFEKYRRQTVNGGGLYE